jgi:hypothetical protein
MLPIGLMLICKSTRLERIYMSNKITAGLRLEMSKIITAGLRLVNTNKANRKLG